MINFFSPSIIYLLRTLLNVVVNLKYFICCIKRLDLIINILICGHYRIFFFVICIQFITFLAPPVLKKSQTGIKYTQPVIFYTNREKVHSYALNQYGSVIQIKKILSNTNIWLKVITDTDMSMDIPINTDTYLQILTDTVNVY